MTIEKPNDSKTLHAQHTNVAAIFARSLICVTRFKWKMV